MRKKLNVSKEERLITRLKGFLTHHQFKDEFFVCLIYLPVQVNFFASGQFPSFFSLLFFLSPPLFLPTYLPPLSLFLILFLSFFFPSFSFFYLCSFPLPLSPIGMSLWIKALRMKEYFTIIQHLRAKDVPFHFITNFFAPQSKATNAIQHFSRIRKK